MPSNHQSLANWLDVAQDDTCVDLGRIKKALSANGVNARGWRLYLDYGDALFTPLQPQWVGSNRPLSSGDMAAVYLKLLQACEMDVLPPMALVASLHHWSIPDQRLSLLPPGLLRAAWKACIAAQYRDEDIEDFIAESIVPVAQWFFATRQHEAVDHNRLKAGWQNLQRDYEAHCQQARRESLKNLQPWFSPVDTAVFGGARFVHLGTPAALEEEGDILHHCIGTYAEVCAHSGVRAYSVRQRKTGMHLASLTVLFSAEKNHWQLASIKGLCNAEVEPWLLCASIGLLRSLDEATAQNPELQKQFKEQDNRIYEDFMLDQI